MKQKGSKAAKCSWYYIIQSFVSRIIVRTKSDLIKPAEELCGKVPVATPKRLEYIPKAVIKWQG